MSKRH